MTSSTSWLGGASHLREDGHADVVVARLVNQRGQPVRGDRSRDGLLPRLRRQTHRQVLLVRQQIGAGRVQLLHLLPQHAGGHSDQAPVFELSGLLVELRQQRPDRGAFATQTGVPVHPPVREPTARTSQECLGGSLRRGRAPSLVFEEDVEDIGLVLQTLRVPQQLGQGAVVDGAAGLSRDDTLRGDDHLRALQSQSWTESELDGQRGQRGGGTGRTYLSFL